MLANKHFLINEMRSGLGSVLYHYIVRSEWGSFPSQALKIFSSCVCVYPQEPTLPSLDSLDQVRVLLWFRNRRHV